MTKEEKKQQKLKAKCQDVYNRIQASLGLEQIESTNEKIHKIVEHCVEMQSNICKDADYVKIDLVEQVNNLMPHTDLEASNNEATSVPKREWLEFVKLAYLQKQDKMNDKRIKKYEKNLEQLQFLVNLRSSFFQSKIINDSTVELAENTPNNNIVNDPSTFKPEEFEKILDDAVDVYERIKEYKAHYNDCATAAYYVSDFTLTPQKFKQIVDWHYYVKGGYPSPDTPPRLWKVINDFVEAKTMLQSYEFDLWDKVLDNFPIGLTEKSESHNEYGWSTKEE